MSPEDTQHLYMLDTHSPEELERFRLENRVRELEEALQPFAKAGAILNGQEAPASITFGAEIWERAIAALGDRR